METTDVGFHPESDSTIAERELAEAVGSIEAQVGEKFQEESYLETLIAKFVDARIDEVTSNFAQEIESLREEIDQYKLSLEDRFKKSGSGHKI